MIIYCAAHNAIGICLGAKVEVRLPHNPVIEVVRRRAVNPKILNYIQSGFAVLLIGFMLWIAFYDIGDWARSANSERKANVPIVFAPKK